MIPIPAPFPHYVVKIPDAMQKAIQAGTVRPGQLCRVYVAHDDWCNQLAGRDPCNCNPDVRVHPDGPERQARSGPDSHGAERSGVEAINGPAATGTREEKTPPFRTVPSWSRCTPG